MGSYADQFKLQMQQWNAYSQMNTNSGPNQQCLSGPMLINGNSNNSAQWYNNSLWSNYSTPSDQVSKDSKKKLTA